MDLGLLRSFVAVAETGSFSAASERVHLSQSSVSHQIARLEQRLGRRLFDRTTRCCSLTSSGTVLLEQAREIVQRLDEVEQAFRPESLRGHLRLGVPDDAHLFAPIAAAVLDFASEQPRVSLDLRAGLSDDLLGGIKSGDLDLALVREIPGRQTEHTIITEDLVWIGKPAPGAVPPAELAIALVSEPCAYRRAAIQALTDAGLSYRTVLSCS